MINSATEHQTFVHREKKVHYDCSTMLFNTQYLILKQNHAYLYSKVSKYTGEDSSFESEQQHGSFYAVSMSVCFRYQTKQQVAGRLSASQ